jgi:hypothetical protein
MKVRKRWLLVGVLLVLAAAMSHLLSSRRDLEVALGTNSPPWSLRNAEVRTDGWTDYAVTACFEIDPEDMRELLKNRPYEVVEKLPAFVGGNFAREPDWSYLPDAERFEVAHVFELEKHEPIFVCRIWVNEDFSKAFVFYGVD